MTTLTSPTVTRVAAVAVEVFAVEGLRPGLDLTLQAREALGVPDPGWPRDPFSRLTIRRITARPTSETSAIVVIESDHSGVA